MTKESGQFTARLGSTLREIRENREFTREAVAQHIGKAPWHMAAIELGQRCPSIDTLHDLICFYEVSADRVFDLPNEDSILNRIVLLSASCPQDQQEFIADFIELIKRHTFKEK